MLREIGGYIEFETYHGSLFHDEAIKLNYARYCLEYVLEKKKIKKILIPKLLCNSVADVCKKQNVEICYYSVGIDFLPIDVQPQDDEWIYLVNYYGQLENDIIRHYKSTFGGRIILDNVQAFFRKPIEGIDTIYTCRKYFGVPDGAFLYMGDWCDTELEQDFSSEKMSYILGRYEQDASNFYPLYVASEETISHCGKKRMSALTENILRSLDYEQIKKRRKENYDYLFEEFKGINKLQLNKIDDAYMYPLYINEGSYIRKQLQDIKIYVPIIWPDLFARCSENELEYDMAKNILPLPIDHRYGLDDMEYVAKNVKNLLQ